MNRILSTFYDSIIKWPNSAANYGLSGIKVNKKNIKKCSLTPFRLSIETNMNRIHILSSKKITHKIYSYINMSATAFYSIKRGFDHFESE